MSLGVLDDELDETGDDAVVLKNVQRLVVICELEEGVDDPVVERLLSRVIQERDKELQSTVFSKFNPVDRLSAIEAESGHAVGFLFGT